jgi:hypothetical protein
MYTHQHICKEETEKDERYMLSLFLAMKDLFLPVRGQLMILGFVFEECLRPVSCVRTKLQALKQRMP